MLKFSSLLGLFFFIAVVWLFSENRRRFPWRTLFWGLVLQFSVALFILKTEVGLWAFEAMQMAVGKLIGSAAEGTGIVFGALARHDSMGKVFGANDAAILAIEVVGTIIIISATSSLLYHFGILQRVVRSMAWVMRRLMGTSGSETVSAAANIFMGQTEAPLTIKPYLPRMTRSELHAMMTGGFATIAGSVLTVYTGVFKIPVGDLLTASSMSAIASLYMAKIMIPETEVSETAAGETADIRPESINAIDAICLGASDGMKLALNVVAMLVAFVALVSFANFLIAKGLVHVGYTGRQPLQEALGYLNWPLARMMGIPTAECQKVAQILGERVVLNEFIGYMHLAEMKAQLSERSFRITTYALCGFANLGSIAIQIGGIGVLVPNRSKDLARLGAKAMGVGLASCYTTACIVGIIG
ncbi:MAG TPA: nucleoside transporter C-terminal domain-containing protein [Candidatus Limnocylindria bacterium]|jgi:CNT family concentrative nucleoside transporter|nr:nucleoside transporter C-terminal domain-containing protein [Candidatus Limnocylindria bacterium]